jgi:dCMP deaminase
MERPTKEKFYLNLAEVVKERSTCTRLKVGAIIANKDLTQFSLGYNGNYARGPNVCDSNEPGNCGCIHAEVNALIKPRNYKATIIFLTDSPCVNCAKLIINAGITTVYYRNKYRLIEGLVLLENNQVIVRQI